MHIEITSIVEEDDGSATLTVEMDEETKLFMINHALVDVLQKATWEFKKKFDEPWAEPTEDFFGEKRIDVISTNGNDGEHYEKL